LSVERLEDGSTLDSTSMSCACLHAPPARASTSAGQAADDDVEEGNNGIDNGLEDSGNGVNNGHDAVADGPEDGLDLYSLLVTMSWEKGRLVNVRRKRRHPC
jgi:hypothetical protein